VIRLLQGTVNAAKKADPEWVDGVLRNMASAVGRLSPELILALLSRTDDATGNRAPSWRRSIRPRSASTP
jgi:hypothetical protein